MDKLNSIFGGAKDLAEPVGPVLVQDDNLAGAIQMQVGFQTAAVLAAHLFTMGGIVQTYEKCFEQALEHLIRAQNAYPGLIHSTILRLQAEQAQQAEKGGEE